MSSVPRPDDKRPSAHEETIANSAAGSVGSGSTGSKDSAGFSLHPSLHDTPKAPRTLEEFSRYLTLSGLMSADEVQSFSSSLQPRDAAYDAEAFAALLVQANKLTPYQAETLKQGHTRGLVLGNYVILDKLGEGGMGMVFKARHRLMKRIVALKVLPPSMTQSTDAVQRFHREVEVAARLTHPNIAAAHDADQADGIHFLVMEYVEGPNLSALVKETGPLSPPLAMNIIAQAARGLSHAHQHGVVHRDIKPGNLLVGRDGVVKVLDMGLAQLQAGEQNAGDKAELTQSGRIMGTVDYMAPEQALDAKNVDQRADIYSLGCTLFYLLAGRPVSPEGTLTQKLLWHQTETVPTLQSVSPEVPEALEPIFRQMVAKRANERQATMAEVVAQLEPLLADIPAEQLQLPLEGFELRSGPGSNTDISRHRAKLTVVERQTRVDYGALDDQSLPGVLPPAPRKPNRLVPALIGLALAGVFAGVALFAYFAPPGKNDKKQNQVVATNEDAKLIIASSQPNARVFINGKEQGQTNGAEPYQLEVAVAPGEYQVRVEKEGFKTFEDKVALKPGKPLTLSAALGARPAVANIVVEVPGAQVSVDGRVQGTPSGKGPYSLPVTLDAGEHLLRVEAEGYETKEEKLDVKSGEKFEKSVRLAERPYRALLTFVFSVAHKNVDAPVTLVDTTGQTHTPRKWADVPASYSEIREVDLTKGALQNEELGVLKRAETLQALSLADTKVDDEGMKQLAELTNLTRLDLRNTPITDKALSRLKNLEALRELDLRGTKVSDVGMESLVGLPLESLRLSGTALSDAGVKTLSQIKTLKSLAVDGTRVTEDGYLAMGKVFAKNPIDKNDLDPELSLARRLLRGGSTISIVPEVSSAPNPVTVSDAQDLPSERFHIAGVIANGSRDLDDSVVTEFKGLTRLSAVDLDGSAITEDGLAQLRQVSTLRTVNLGYLRVAKASVDSLRQALPDAEISWQGPRDRVVAEWVIKQGGAVRITASPSKLARQAADLPENRDFRLEEIHLVNRRDVAAEDLVVIKDLNDLKLINLVGTAVSEAAIQAMTGCTQVTTLAVSGPKVTSSTLAAIVERFPQLERLYVADTAIDGQGLQQLKNVPKLKQLSLAGTQIHDEDLAPLRALTNLAWLSLDGAPLTDGAVAQLAAIKSLKVLSLDDERLGAGDNMMEAGMLPESPERKASQVTDAGIEELRAALKNTNILGRELSAERLAARWVLEQGGTVVAAVGDEERKVEKLSDLPRQACQVREVALRSAARLQPDVLATRLRQCTGLRSLDLSGNAGLQDSHIGAIGTLESIESLNLAQTGVSDRAFEKLGALPHLKVLGLQGTLVTGSGLAKNPLPKLTQLHVGTTDFSDAALRSLKDSPELAVLDLSNCKAITDRGVAELAALEKLESLNLSLTRVTDAVGPTLAKFAQLKRLNLYGVPVTDTAVGGLAKLELLEDINLARTKVTDGAMSQLSGLKNLRRVSVYGTTITDGAVQPLRDRGVEVNKSADPSQRDPSGGSGGFGM